MSGKRRERGGGEGKLISAKEWKKQERERRASISTDINTHTQTREARRLVVYKY